MCVTAHTRVLHASSVTVLTGLQPGGQGYQSLPSPNLRLIQALQPRFEQTFHRAFRLSRSGLPR